MQNGILLATINAKWIHPSLALRLLKANLGSLEERCEIMEFALRQPLCEKTVPIIAAKPRVLGLSVSIWNLTATAEMLKELCKTWGTDRPFVVLGGPEVSYLPKSTEIFEYADCCVLGEGETAFRELCQSVFEGKQAKPGKSFFPANPKFRPEEPGLLKSAYNLYTDEDLCKKLVYVEASRGCPYSCGFCLSANDNKIREFPLEPFLEEMDSLIRRGARVFKFLDRSFNANIPRAKRIMEFFIEKLESSKQPFTVHFEMVPSRFPDELMQTLAHFPHGSLRLEIGIQTLNPEVAALIGRTSNPKLEMDTLHLIRQKTNAIVHADLIAGLPGETLVSFANGFDALWQALSFTDSSNDKINSLAEIQLGILKLLPGAPIAKHSAAFGMCYNPLPPYEITQSNALPACDLDRIKNFARFWELIVNRGLADIGRSPVFDRFMALSDALLARFGRNWGIPKADLLEAVREYYGDSKVTCLY